MNIFYLSRNPISAAEANQMSIKDGERLAFAGLVVFYGVVFYMAVYAFYLTGVA